MRKLVLLLLAVCLTAGVAMAEDMAIYIDLAPTFKGIVANNSETDTMVFPIYAGLEKLIKPNWSIGGELDLIFGNVYDISCMYLGAQFKGRYYVQSAKMEKLFLGAALGFNMLSVDGKTKSEEGGMMGMTFGLNLGYRIPMSEKAFIEPSMSYNYAKRAEFEVFAPLNGWQSGLRFGMNM